MLDIIILCRPHDDKSSFVQIMTPKMWQTIIYTNDDSTIRYPYVAVNRERIPQFA